jgi:hypothetical protein
MNFAIALTWSTMFQTKINAKILCLDLNWSNLD